MLPSRFLRPLLRALLFLALPLVAAVASPSPFDGRWRLDREHSSALDGWSAWDLVIAVDGTHVTLRHDMQWGAKHASATNVVDTAQPVELPRFFRVEQRHMAVYPARDAMTAVRAGWLDDGRTLRLEAETPVETSQGNTTLRIYSEYRLLEGGHDLVLIELHSSRPHPLIYHFSKIAEK